MYCESDKNKMLYNRDAFGSNNIQSTFYVGLQANNIAMIIIVILIIIIILLLSNIEIENDIIK